MIQFVDLKTQYNRYQAEMEEAVLSVLRSGQYILGPIVEQLEAALATFAGTAYAVSCASGTDALVMALMAKGVGRGDIVFTTPFTFMASAEAIALVGATPAFVDVDPVTYNLDPNALRRAIRAVKSGNVNDHVLPFLDEGRAYTARGIIAVDLFGLPADYDAINAIAVDEGLFVIQDAAQSFGAELHGRRTGSHAEIGCTSFFPAKPLGCYGDGGALFTDDGELDTLFRSIRVHGQGSDRYENVRLGITGRLDAIQAAVLLVKLRAFPDELIARQRIANAYSSRIAEAGLPLVTPRIPAGSASAWAQYSVLAEDDAARAAMRARLDAVGIPTAIYYPKPLHLQGAFADLRYETGDFPVAENLAGRIFSLPMHPYLNDDQIAAVVGKLCESKR
ncbi:DegT/DnrJ/EryC1/StrS family aminotransferase [Allosphingosinicella humi]